MLNNLFILGAVGFLKFKWLLISMKKDVIKKEKDVLRDALVFAKENKGFMVALLILLVSILFLQVSLNNDFSLEKANYTLDMHTNNQMEIDAYLSSIDEQLIEDKEDILDDYFLASARSDFVWLKEKEIQLFDSKPSADLYAKEAAFSVFLLKMIELNEAFGVRLGEPDYNTTIEAAKNEQILVPLIFTQDKIITLLDGDVREANIFSNTLNYLFTDYIELKKNKIASETVIKFQYVESKKLLLVPQLTEFID